MIELQQLPHETSWASASITRIGEGRQTRNQISPAPVEQAPTDSKYRRGKYGHLVQS